MKARNRWIPFVFNSFLTRKREWFLHIIRSVSFHLFLCIFKGKIRLTVKDGFCSKLTVSMNSCPFLLSCCSQSYCIPPGIESILLEKVKVIIPVKNSTHVWSNSAGVERVVLKSLAEFPPVLSVRNSITFSKSVTEKKAASKFLSNVVFFVIMKFFPLFLSLLFEDLQFPFSLHTFPKASQSTLAIFSKSNIKQVLDNKNCDTSE